MEPFLHRNPGIVGAAADACAASENVFLELICDGIHIHPSMIRSVFRLFGEDHMIFISDSMRACGMEDGIYELGGQRVEKTEAAQHFMTERSPVLSQTCFPASRMPSPSASRLFPP